MPDVEYPAELYYRVALTAAISLTPNIQYFHRPGGFDEAEDVVVVGLKTVVSF